MTISVEPQYVERFLRAQKLLELIGTGEKVQAQAFIAQMSPPDMQELVYDLATLVLNQMKEQDSGEQKSV